MESKLEVESGPPIPHQTRIFALILVAMIVIFTVLTLLAGLPPADQLVSFMIGIVILIAITAGIGLLGWHLMLRPLPANVRVSQQSLLSVPVRQMMAAVLTIGTFCMGVAGVWDEIWHSKYGIPFGEDFFWRPHLMLYFGLLSLVALSLWSWWLIYSRGKGSMQQRFRANPLLGINFLGGMFAVYAIGADPIWHRMYGADIAPWSLPHLLILILIFVMGLLAITYHKSLMPPREWQARLSLNGRDLLISLVMVGALLAFLLIFTIQWYGAGESSHMLAQVTGYPIWLFPLFITFLVTLFGITGLHATRRIGTVTLIGLLTFGLRLVLDTNLEGVRDGTTPLWVMVPMMIAIDVWYAIAIYRTQKPPPAWTTALVVALVFAVPGLPLIGVLFPFLELTLINILSMVIASAVAAFGGVWLARMLGDLRFSADAEATPVETARFSLSNIWANGLLYIAFAVFLVFFVATASPPV